MAEIISNMKKASSDCLAVMNATFKLRNKKIEEIMPRIENLIKFGDWKIIVEGISRSEAVDASSH